jgi:hypothetical protein
MNYFRLAIGFAAISLGSIAMATDLTFIGTADDAFNAYISTDPSVTGTLFSSGTNWPSVQSGTVTLTAGVTNYLHVEAFDVVGPPSMFISSVNLSDSVFHFANDGQTALTGDANWTGSLIGFGGATSSITDKGANGTSPWGFLSGVSPDAHFVWIDDSTSGHRYFTLKIETVPEPASMIALSAGLVLLVRRKRSI